jgi:hypothetical protein
MAKYRMARLGVLDAPWQHDEIEGVEYIPPVPPLENGLWLKEEVLFRLIQKEQARDRKCMVFVTQIHRRDPTVRWKALMEKYGIRAAIMQQEITERISFIRGALEDGADVIITSAPLVKEGIDLPMIHTLIWWGVEFNMYTLPQANRRIYRLNQERDCEIYYLGWNGTIQAQKFDYAARKLKGQQILQGDEINGLAALRAEADFLTMLSDAVTDERRFLESDLSLDSLPPLMRGGYHVPAEPVDVWTGAWVPAVIITRKGGNQFSLFSDGLV